MKVYSLRSIATSEKLLKEIEQLSLELENLFFCSGSNSVNEENVNSFQILSE